MRLDEVPKGKTVIIDKILLKGKDRHRLLELGLTKGIAITPFNKQGKNGPTAYYVRDSLYALNKEDAHNIEVKFDN